MAEEKTKKTNFKEEEQEMLVRVMGFDIAGSKNLYSGLTKIKGISWAISNATCKKLGFERTQKIGELSKDEIKKIEDFLKSIEIYSFMKNRISDPETGEETHLYGHDLTMAKGFDIKRMRKMKSYKGIRHGLNLPVRGQRTRAHFRKKGIAVGVKRKAK